MASETKEAKEKLTEGHGRGAVATATAAPLRILIVGPSLDILGGQAVQAVRLIERLREEPSLDVSFLPINPPFPKLLKKVQGIKYVRSIRSTLLYWVSLLARVRKYDVIHIYAASYLSFMISPTPAFLIAKLYGKKILLNYHSGHAERHLERWKRTAIPTIRLADITIVQSEYLVDVFARFGLPAQAIFNHIETEHFHFRERRPLRPLFLSNRNLEPIYNVGCVIRAFALVQERFPDACLTVAGDGSQRAELERLANDLRLRNVKFTGLIAPEKMVELYDAADIFLNGSEVDNMPLSLLEAFAAGLPVVTTDAGGIPYIVADEETGFVVKKGDHAAMAERAIRFLTDNELAVKMANRAREECSRYSWAEVRNKWLSVYHALAQDRVVAVNQHAACDQAPTNE
ncbi:MAG TPA: glycosyltransferase family 4 protein [Pyrinomonadaceae bacterium]|jgi:glycosyltransferase involved in cell wall biosynthesis